MFRDGIAGIATLPDFFPIVRREDEATRYDAGVHERAGIGEYGSGGGVDDSLT